MRISSSIVLVILLPAFSTVPLWSQVLTKLKGSTTLAVAEPGDWQPVQKGIEFRKIVLQRPDLNQSIDLKILRFDTQWIVPRILRGAQFGLRGTDAKTFAEKSGAIAVINASYFDTDGRPLAFLKVEGQMINRRVAKSSLYTGVFGIKNRQPFIVHRDKFLPDQADEALQAGPLLLLHGAAQGTAGVPIRASRRMLIGIAKDQKILIAVTDNIIGGLYWAELQEVFSAAQWQLQTPELLNLDGGGSAQLYIKAGKLDDFVPGTTEVPVAIGFFSKDN